MSNFIKYETNSGNGNRMSATLTAAALLAPPSKRSSNGSNEFNPRIILNNSLKNSRDMNCQSVIFGANGNNSYVARNSTTSNPDFLMYNPNLSCLNIHSSGQLNPNDLINNNQSMNSGSNNRRSSFFHNIQDFIRGNSGNGAGMMQNMYLGPLKPSFRLSDPEAKSSPNSNSSIQNQGDIRESEKESSRLSNEVKLSTPFNID